MVDVNQIAFDGIGAVHVTCASTLDNTAQGKVAKFSGNKTVTIAESNDSIHCVIKRVEKDGAAVVQLKGYVEVSYNGATAPTVGLCKLSANSTGGVKVDDTLGKEYLVMMVDTKDKIIGIYL